MPSSVEKYIVFILFSSSFFLGNSARMCGGAFRNLCQISPTPGQEEKRREEIACEGKELHLTCEGESTLDIHNALYGRHNTDTCPHNQDHSTTCSAEGALQKVRNACQHKSSCIVEAVNAVFRDPCVGVFKYLQVSYTCENIEWHLVFKGVSGAGDPDLYHLWRDDGSLNALNDSARALTDSLKAHFKSPMVDRWSELEIKRVKIAFYKDGVEKAYMIFDGRGTGKMDWFALNKITNSSYDDLTSGNPNFFSITGHSDDHHSRHWFSNRNYGGCAVDYGWTVVITDRGPCNWDNTNTYYPKIMFSPTAVGVMWQSDQPAWADFFAIFHEYTEPPHVTKLTEITTSGFTEDKDSNGDSTTKQFVGTGNTEEGEVTYEDKATTPTTAAVMGRQNKEDESLVKAAVGSVVSVFILIGLAVMILYFMKKKKNNGTMPQSVSFGKNVSGAKDGVHSTEISDINRVDIGVVHGDSEYNTLHDVAPETHEYAYARYPGDGENQRKPLTVYAYVSNDVPKNNIIPSKNGSESKHMGLQHDTITAANARQLATLSKAEHSYAGLTGDNQREPTEMVGVSKDSPGYFTLQKEQESDVSEYTRRKDQDGDVTKLKITSLPNDDAYAELRIDGNDSTRGPYDILNRHLLIPTGIPEDVNSDYNKLIITPSFEEESEEYNHLDLTSLKLDESVTDPRYGKLEMKPIAESKKPTAKPHDGHEGTLPSMSDDDTVY